MNRHRGEDAIEHLRRAVDADPAARAEYERLAPRFAAVRTAIAARRRAGLSQRELAERMGVTQSVVGRLEGGRHSPSVDTLAQFAAAAGYELRIAFVKPRQGATAGLKPLRAATAGQKRRTMASDRGNAVRADATRR